MIHGNLNWKNEVVCPSCNAMNTLTKIHSFRVPELACFIVANTNLVPEYQFHLQLADGSQCIQHLIGIIYYKANHFMWCYSDPHSLTWFHNSMSGTTMHCKG